MLFLSLVISVGCIEPPSQLPNSKLEKITWMRSSKKISYPTKDGSWVGWVLLPNNGQKSHHVMLLFHEDPSLSEWFQCVEKFSNLDTVYISSTTESKPLGIEYLKQQSSDSTIKHHNCP